MKFDFVNPLTAHVRQEFPSVENFYVDHCAHNVVPVRYDSGRHGERMEYPPVARWRVGSVRFAYVLRPRFVQRNVTWPLVCRAVLNVPASETKTEPSYDGEMEQLFQILRWSVEGKSAADINTALHGRPTP